MAKKALIIAAGMGSRLRFSESDTPKPLQKVAGLPLLKRIILTSKKAGIEEFYIVVGYKKEEIKKYLNQENLKVKITLIENPDWKKSNGLSVLAAKDYIDDDFVLLMSDHIFQADTLEKLNQSEFGENIGLLGVDKKLAHIFDMDDATKVKTAGNKILEIGKEIKEYDCIDTGMFLLKKDFFNVLENLKNSNPDVSLSNGIQKLASLNKMAVVDIGDGFWHDVDTPESREHAEKELIHACRKSTDGIVSRNFNRHISLAISSVLIKTPISANLMTFFISIIGILSGVLVATGNYWGLVWGTILFKFTSILDGCDGEISKLKMTQSQAGAWFDTLSDNLTYLIYFIGLCIGQYRLGNPDIFYLGGLAGFGLILSLGLMFSYLIKNKQAGTLLAIQEEFHQQAKTSFIKRIFSRLQFLTKRDVFSVVFLLLAILNQPEIIIWLYLIATNLVWIILLFHKPSTQTSS